MEAYEEDVYPFLSYEFKLMERAIQKEIPLIGTCLGCQMLAKVLGAKVYKGERGKEIGWMEVFKSGEHPYFEVTPLNFQKVLLELEKYENQAFVYKRAVGIQSHIEVDKHMLKEWVEEYKSELVQEGLKPHLLTSFDGREQEPLLQSLLKRLLYL